MRREEVDEVDPSFSIADTEALLAMLDTDGDLVIGSDRADIPSRLVARCVCMSMAVRKLCALRFRYGFGESTRCAISQTSAHPRASGGGGAGICGFSSLCRGCVGPSRFSALSDSHEE